MSFLVSSCGLKEETPSRPERTKIETIEFYDSIEIANAFAALPVVKDYLLTGNYAKAEELSNKADIKKAIPEDKGCLLNIFGLCQSCRDGKCSECKGKGNCGNCDDIANCTQCLGLPRTTSICESCICRSCGGNRICRSCHGNKQVNCSTCRGTGWGSGTTSVQCTNCKGKGQLNYQISRGQYTCTSCRGTGKIAGARQKCSACRGTAKVNCNSCIASGRCSTCHGRGRTMNCKDCAGSNQIVKICTTCNGSGKCRYCGGKNVCSTCQGNKYCKLCNGLSIRPALSIWIDKSWLRRSYGIHSPDDQLSSSVNGVNLSYRVHLITTPSNSFDGIVLIANPNEYSKSAKYLFIME